MWKINASSLYTILIISNALESNSSFIENKALPAEGPEYVGEKELQYVVSLGVFKNGNYTHICLAVMITGLNGITAGKCGRYKYYAEKADLIESEKNLAEENRTKLHVNTKRPIHIDPDTFYTVIHFIDFDRYLFDKNKAINYYEEADIGIFVLKKEVQYTRPVLNVRMSATNEWSKHKYFTMIGMSTRDDRHSGKKMLMKKRIEKIGIFLPMRFSHSRAIRLWFSYSGSFTLEDLGAPVYVKDQYVGIVVDKIGFAIVAIDAHLEEHINRIIALTWIPRINERQVRGSAKASTRSAIWSNVNTNN